MMNDHTFPTPAHVPLDYAVPEPSDSRWGKGFLAVCGTLVLSGLGHCFAGRYRRGAVWFGLVLSAQAIFLLLFTVPALQPGLLVWAPLALLLMLALYVDAFLTGRRSDRRMLRGPVWRYLAGVALLLPAFVVSKGLKLAREPVLAATGSHTYLITTLAMQPTLRPGDRIMTHRVIVPKRGDLIIFHPPTRRDIFTQRVVGLPGERVEIVGGAVLINGKALPPGPRVYSSIPGLDPGNGCEGNPITLGPDEYYVLGDNSQRAYDSRYWHEVAPGHQPGALPAANILGRVTAIYYPFKRIRQFK